MNVYRWGEEGRVKENEFSKGFILLGGRKGKQERRDIAS